MVIDTSHWKYLTWKEFDIKFSTWMYPYVNNRMKPNVKYLFESYYKFSTLGFNAHFARGCRNIEFHVMYFQWEVSIRNQMCIQVWYYIASNTMNTSIRDIGRNKETLESHRWEQLAITPDLMSLRHQWKVKQEKQRMEELRRWGPIQWSFYKSLITRTTIIKLNKPPCWNASVLCLIKPH